MPAVADTEQPPVRAARRGDPDAWDALLRRHQLPLYAYVAELVRHEQTALDLVQETFIAAARHLPGLRDDTKFSSWLFGIAHQKVLQHWRKPARVHEPVEELAEVLPADTDDPRDWLIRREREEEFFTRLAELPEPQREVLLLHFLEDFSLEEIADITSTPVGTVKSRLHYAKRALRKLLEETKS
jgi:RNA polymerase sigma-70 factor (ECF subfamily)